eukprot:6638694-Pyramimonas_sp.AAC.1
MPRRRQSSAWRPREKSRGCGFFFRSRLARRRRGCISQTSKSHGSEELWIRTNASRWEASSIVQASRTRSSSCRCDPCVQDWTN